MAFPRDIDMAEAGDIDDDSEDIYNEDEVEQEVGSDQINPEEAGFMHGYEKTAEEDFEEGYEKEGDEENMKA